MLGLLAIGSMLALTTSCKKECTCTQTFSNGYKETSTQFPENYNAKNCKELSTMMSGNGILVDCK